MRRAHARSGGLLPRQPGGPAVRCERVELRFGCDVVPARGVAAARQQMKVDVVARRTSARDRNRVDAGADRTGRDRGDIEQDAHGGSLRRRTARHRPGVRPAVTLGARAPTELAGPGETGPDEAAAQWRVVEHATDLLRARLAVAGDELRARRRARSPRVRNRSRGSWGSRAPWLPPPGARSPRTATRGRTRRPADRARRVSSTVARR